MDTESGTTVGPNQIETIFSNTFATGTVKYPQGSVLSVLLIILVI